MKKNHSLNTKNISEESTNYSFFFFLLSMLCFFQQTMVIFLHVQETPEAHSTHAVCFYRLLHSAATAPPCYVGTGIPSSDRNQNVLGKDLEQKKLEI